MDREMWNERKKKIDARMMEHPFLNDFTRAQRRAAEKKEILTQLADYGRCSKKDREKKKLPVIEGFTAQQVQDYWGKRQSFLNLLVEQQGIHQLIRQAIIRDLTRSIRSTLEEEEMAEPDDPGLEDQQDQGGKGWFRVMLEDERDYIALTNKNKWISFDGVSYMNAVQDSIRGYDAGYRNEQKQTKASFVNLMASCYLHQLGDTKKEQVSIATSRAYELPEEISQVLSAISDYLKEKNAACTVENLTQGNELYRQVIQHTAKATGMKPEAIRTLLPILQKIRAESLDAPVGEEDQGSMGELVADPGTVQDMTQDRLEKQSLAFRFIQMVSKKRMKEYNRLLMNNLLLQPIHPVAGRPVYVAGKKEYADQLKQNSAGLYKMVFHLPYLEYIEWVKPAAPRQKTDTPQQKEDAPRQKGDPSRIEVLCDGYPLKELNAKSIAAYKKVTPANVSYYSKRFAVYLEEMMEQQLEITG